MSRFALPGLRLRTERSTDPRHLALRRQLGLIILAWVFGSYWLWTISGAAMTQFAKALGTPDYGFGILAALPFVGTLIQIPASYYLTRYGHRKKLVLVCGALGRFMWVVAALIPWALPGARTWWWPVMAGALLISWLAANVAVPAWMNWMGDVIPNRLRGRFFARRNLIGQPIGLIVALGIGYALDLALHVRGHRPDIMLQVTSVVLAVGGLFGVLDILCFRWVVDPHEDRPPQPINLFALMRRPLRSKNFRRYLLFNFTFMLAMGFVGQYIWLYLFDVCGWSNLKANLLVICVPMVMMMIGYPIWGRLIDQLGKKPVLLITGSITAFGALSWLFITPQSMMPGYALVLLVMFVWPGMEISNFNIILGMAGGRKDENPSLGTAYVALNSIAIAVGGTLSGLGAGAVAKWLGDFHYAVPALGITLTYHGVLFLGSTVLRGVALLWAAGLAEPKAAGTREAIRYMTVSIYSNVRQAVLMPTRIVGRVARWTYRLSNRD